MTQVEGIQEPIADDALRHDGNHVLAIDRILGGFRRHHLPDHEGMVQRARSCHPLSAQLATDVQCHSSRQRQYKLFSTVMHLHDFDTLLPNFRLILASHHRWRCCLASLGHLF
jgi:hypothetical protein